jgi:WD repeat-containing protein 23
VHGSETVHLVRIHNNHDDDDSISSHTTALDFEAASTSGGDVADNFCFNALAFQGSNNATLYAAGSDHRTYCFDFHKQKRTARWRAHSDAVNAASFVSGDENLLLTAGDDLCIKLWDLRQPCTLNAPVAAFCGHTLGVTHLEADGASSRHFLSTGKDHAVKLWDVRRNSSRTFNAATMSASRATRDYRYEMPAMYAVPSLKRRADDASLQTYRSGHTVFGGTPGRARFSPRGGEFIATTSHCGAIFVYARHSGELVSKLRGHADAVADLVWFAGAGKERIYSGGNDNLLCTFAHCDII